ncbi:hypothetical protein BBJ29_009724 [Phytophthora kernoviae]|uniref:HECT-type E3 ubiquitin transferase n=1 Tax=Phytophthora kernoviae TaxID=325452 RepID=A0A3F2RDG9_9STRA|nr:hypothetical protein BBJ29_009724 [Phytophthora kernoviae]RLN51772.1 hypothetical protein BBP00_00009826 [Phytophthora kernoviae]
MFLRDNELTRGGGGGRRDDRACVLQLAREQREARGRRKEENVAAKQLQAFARGRLSARRLQTQNRAEFDQKLGDISKLKAILQLPTMPLPYETLFELLRLLLSFYTGDAADSERLSQLKSPFCNALMDFMVHLLKTTHEILEAFVMEVFSVPLLNQVVAADNLLQFTDLCLWDRLLSAGLRLSVFDLPASPVNGIASEAWFLGNILWISERVEGKSDNIVLNEVHLITKLLQAVPPTTYAASGVAVTWTKETRDFEDFIKNVDLIHARSSDPYMCMLALFCMAYNHLLVVMDDEEMYELEYPLPLRQIERIVLALKRALHDAYWTHANLAPSTDSVAFGVFVVDMATRLMRLLYNRCSRQPFTNVTSWISAELDSNQLIEEVLQGTPRANKLIQSMPYLVPFADRVKLFQRLVKADKEIHQSENCSVYRIRINRGAILEDGLRKLNTIRTNLKKRINVVFVNSAGREEVGIDAGGLFKEFWLDLSTLAFDLQYGLFLTTHDQLLYPNPNSASGHFSRESDHLTLFQFVGRILGKALYEGIVVQPKFAHFFLSKLLHSFNQLNELPSLDPEIYKNLMFLKSYDGDVEDLGLTHTVVKEVFGEQKEIEIIPGGGDVPVTNRNKTRYIHLVGNYYLNTQIREQCSAFRMGLSDLIDPRWLQMFNEPELQVLISGKSGKIDVDDLKANVRYTGGYYALDKRVAWLWQALVSYTPSEQASFLRFTTSCQRAPSLGFSSLTPQFCVQKIPIRSDDELLPSSSTCFNTLKLPTYSSYKVLQQKTTIMAGQDEIRRLMKEAKQKSIGGPNSASSSRTKALSVQPKAASKVTANQPQKPAIPAGFFDDSVADAKARKVDVKELAEKQLDADWAAFQDFADEIEQQTGKEEEEKVEETKEREAVEKLENMEYVGRYRLALERAATLRNGKDKRKLQESTDNDAEDIKAVVKQYKKQKRPKKQVQDSDSDDGFNPCNWRSRGI